MENNNYSTRQQVLKHSLNVAIPVVSTVGICLLLFVVFKFFMPFVVGFAVALMALPVIRFLENKLKIKRGLGLLILISAVLGALFFAIYGLCHALFYEAFLYLQDLPAIMATLEEFFDEIGGYIATLPFVNEVYLTTMADGLFGTLSQWASDKVTSASGIMDNLAKWVVVAITTILSAIFFVFDKEKVTAFYGAKVPLPLQETATLVLDNLKTTVFAYFKACFKILPIVSLAVFIGLWILGVPYALLIGFLVGVMDFLPLFGAGTILIPWALFEGFTGNYSYAIGLVLTYLACQLVRQLIQPKVMGDSMGLSPLLTLFILYIGFLFMGLVGMIIALPVGMTIINVCKFGFYDNMKSSFNELVRICNEFRK